MPTVTGNCYRNHASARTSPSVVWKNNKNPKVLMARYQIRTKTIKLRQVDTVLIGTPAVSIRVSGAASQVLMEPQTGRGSMPGVPLWEGSSFTCPVLRVRHRPECLSSQRDANTELKIEEWTAVL